LFAACAPRDPASNDDRWAGGAARFEGADQTMPVDLSTDLMRATVQIEQALPGGARIIGTGFLINDPTPDGKPRTVLVTANHVFERMTQGQADVGYRIQAKDGAWSYDPEPIVIRRGKTELWTHHPSRDVAAIVVKAPAAFAKAAIPLAWLASDDTFARFNVGQGDEMMVLGYPQGLSANTAGFPILRSGRVASPIDASKRSPTFLLDFRVFPGNSGGPVYIAEAGRRHPGAAGAEDVQFIAGILTQQVELNDQRLEIGIVTEAAFVRETLAQLDRRGAKVPEAPATQSPMPHTADAVADVGRPVSD
jgi:S1-C subfamily serine protease